MAGKLVIHSIDRIAGKSQQNKAGLPSAKGTLELK
jgi:hypothetical protein